MSTPQANGRPCESCGATPAAYRQRNTERQDECVLCARRHGAEINGEAHAALETLGFAVALARGACVTDDQLRVAFEQILTSPDSDGTYPVGGDQVLRIDDLCWERVYEPIS